MVAEQATIARPTECAGLGLHSGRPARCWMRPAEADSGIVFVRRGAGPGGEHVEIPAVPAALGPSARATTLLSVCATTGSDAKPVRVTTVEHLLATLHALGLDNLRIELDGPEVPAFDGSAAPLLECLEAAGRRPQRAPRRVLELAGSVEIREGDRWIRAEPCDHLSLDYAIDFQHPHIGRQHLAIPRLDALTFARELAPARTFGFLHEVDALRAAGLANGGGLENAVVLDEASVLNAGGLRFADEFVRHKLVDLIGDLALLGGELRAHVQVEKGGHSLHHRLVQALAARAGGRAASRRSPRAPAPAAPSGSDR